MSCCRHSDSPEQLGKGQALCHLPRSPRNGAYNRRPIDDGTHDLAIVTNADPKPLMLLRSYNKRAKIESRTFHAPQPAVQLDQSDRLQPNGLVQTDADAGNLAAVRRRAVIRVPGNVVGSGHYQHIRLAPNPTLAVIVDAMQQKLRALAISFILTLHAA